MAWDARSGQTFGQYMRGGAALGRGHTADVVVGERTFLTRDEVVEGRREDGSRFKTTRDQAGNDVTQETTAGGRERQHVRINLR
ncbi:hypothetical protein ACIBEJ_48655 [Nonomuraea sp. NPDC050790]|uniref:hypothetical protein n=1 Tax=Nonomuraea sp. NPDC050790 TaxID=3364371 RepID=UPI0037B1EB91